MLRLLYGQKLSDYLKSRLNGNYNNIIYSVNEEQEYYDMKVAEDGEEYKYE